MTRLDISLLGSYQVFLDGQPLDGFESDKVRALLAYLAVESSRAQRRERLTGLLWASLPEPRATHNLNQALFNLRRLLGDHLSSVAPVSPDGHPFLLSTPQSVQLNPAADLWLDVGDFTRLAGEMDAHPHASLPACPACRQRLQQAAALYRGEFLADFSLGDSLAFHEWCLVTRERMHRLALRTFRQLSACLEQAGELSQALECAWRQVELDALDEDARRQLIALLGRSGQRNAALQQYQSLKNLLEVELDVQPEEETTALYQQLMSQPALPSLKPAAERLPTPLTPFIGRADELTQLQGRMLTPDCRMLTILGPGGSGKTRLGLELTRTVWGGFEHGACFIPFEPLPSVAALAPAVAAALGVPIPEEDSPEQVLLNHLRGKSLLLVLDGCEHLPEAAGWVQTLLRQTSKVKVLVTSRQRLNLTSEYTYPLPGMSVPVIGDDTPELLRNECVQLFLDAAQRASPAYQPAERDLQAIALLCRQVQGVPLAILLAAAWVDLLSPDEIAAEVSRSLDFLSVDWQDQPARQRSLRATFDYTWSLLAESERQVFQALSVFRGSFTYPAAQQIAGATVQGLRLLVDKSVVQRLEGGRYQVHELLSQFAAEKLAQAQESRHAAMERHSRFYAGSFKAWGHGLRGAHMPEARLEMDAEAGNLRQAWEWAAESGNLAHLAQMMDGLFLHYNFSGDCNEAESACRCALQALQERGEAQASRLKAFLLARLATANFSLKRNDQNPALLQASQAELDRAQAAGLDVRLEQAFLRYVQARDCAATDRETAYRLLAESAELFRPVDAWRQWMALNVLGNRYHLSGDLPAAERWLNEALVVARQIGQPISLASTLNELGFVRARQGVVAEGLRLVEESAEILVTSGLQPNVVQGKFQMGLMLLWNGRFAEGRAQIEQCLPLLREPGDRYLCGYVTMCLGLAELNLCDNAPARRHLTEGLQQARQGGYRRDIGFAALGLGMLALAEGDLPAAGAFLQESLAAYPQEQLPDEYGAALGIQALVCRAAGEPAGAWAALEQGLQIVKRMHGLYAAGTCALAAAMLLAERGQARRAVELAHLAFRQPLFGNSSWYRQVIGDPLARLENSLPPEEAEATRQRAAAGDLLQALDALLEPSQQPVMAAV